VPDLANPLIAWYAGHARDLPWRRADFGAWGVLVSEVMLQQTPVTRVIPRLEAWLRRWPTPADLAAASPAEVLKQWDNLGYPRRALRLHQAAIEIRDRFGGVVPFDVDDLLGLTGIGDYTARAVAVFAYGRRHPVVDTNTRRVITRAVHGRSQPGPAARADLDDMDALLPADAAEAAAFNAATMELGALICTSRTPRCESCPIAEHCRWHLLDHPDTGDARPRQATYEGSDRQARGAVLRALRHTDDGRLRLVETIPEWADPAQRERAIASLVADGLAQVSGGSLQLPQPR
jgi:A/G-specific adenine glycosylase